MERAGASASAVAMLRTSTRVTKTRARPHTDEQPSGRRRTIALSLAVAAIAAAAFGAYGPAERVRTTYSWPPSVLPAKAPSQLWFSPLLLAAHRPETLIAAVPCRLPSRLRNAVTPTTVIATARDPKRARALSITSDRGRVVISVGGKELQQLQLPDRTTAAPCTFDLRLEGDQWSLSGSEIATRTGELEEMPRVFGVFSGLDLRNAQRPTISVTTVPHATVPITRQVVFWALAVIFAFTALLLVASRRASRSHRAALSITMSRARHHAHPADAVVAFGLLAWWILAPLNFDDGWVQAREQMYSSARGFSLYYSTLGANLPLDYWVEWANHWLAETTSALVLLRLPTLGLISATWVVCRWIVARATQSKSHATVWVLACAFLVCAVAWSMTLRPEPVVALLASATTACMLSFVSRPSAAALGTAGVCVALALSAHTTGLIALAPVLVASPSLLRWARPRVRVATTIGLASGAILLVLVSVGSDVGQRLHEVETSRAYSEPWQGDDEFTRYASLNVEPSATPIRRLAVGLILLSLAAFLFRKRRTRSAQLDLPAMAAGAGLLLFALIPSKWAWHFGALLGLGAAAVACESARIRSEASRALRWDPWPFFALVAAVAVGHWSWKKSEPWNPVDLRTLFWYDGLAAALSDLVLVLAALVFIGGMLVALRRSQSPYPVPWRVVSLMVPLLALPALAYTAGILVADTARAGTWTLARQNLSAFVGSSGCGLADEVRVPVTRSTRPLRPAGDAPNGTLPAWVPPSPASDIPRFVLGPAPVFASASSWFELPRTGSIGLFVSGNVGESDRVSLEWGRMVNGRVEAAGESEFTGSLEGLAGTAPWRLLGGEELPRPPSAASLVRVKRVTRAVPGTTLAVSGPVMYRTEPLTALVNARGATSLVYPQLLPNFPCTRLPPLSNGVVQPPDYVLVGDALLDEHTSNPFFGLADVYQLERISIADTKHWPKRVIVFRVERDLEGETRVPPDMLTFHR